MARATSNDYPRNEEYEALRTDLIRDPRTKARLPEFVKRCRTLTDFWDFIQPKFPTYKERRRFLQDEFSDLLLFLEEHAVTPLDSYASDVLKEVGSPYAQDAWAKGLERRESDPEGAMTSARTLLESVCKHILDDMGVDYDDSLDLPKLYREVARNLTLSPGQHAEKVFKQVLSGCHSVVEGLGALRNKLSDSHGRGRLAAKPAERHAALTVNLAGAMASFLLETWEARKADQATE